MKRLFCIIGSLLICTSSVFAWNAESFLSDGSAEYQPYSLDPVEDPLDPAQVPMLMSLRDGVAVAAEIDTSFISVSDFFGSLPSVDMGLMYEVNTSLGMPAYYTILKPASFSSTTGVPGGDFPLAFQYYVNGITGPSRDPSVLGSIFGPVFGDTIPTLSGFTVSLPVSHLKGATSVSFDANIALKQIVNTDQMGGGQILVVINNQQVAVLNPYSFVNGFAVFDLSSVQYFSSSPIQSIELEFRTYSSTIDIPYSASGSYNMRYVMSFDTESVDSPLVSGLIVPPGLDGENDKVQGDLDIHHSIESLWTGSMTENFNALDLSAFTFPGGLVAAFALITGIFNDLWNGMGDYKILYVFPLTLGVVLLLIGRISKFSGRSSSGRGGKGDDSA